MKIASLTEAFRYVIKAKKNLFPPPKSKCVIFDKEGSDDLMEYLSKDYHILELRGESINIFILMISMFKYGIRLNFFLSIV